MARGLIGVWRAPRAGLPLAASPPSTASATAPSISSTRRATPTAAATVRKLQELDAHDRVLAIGAHDESLLGIVDFFPRAADDFVARGWARQVRGRFLRDFAEAVGYEGEVVGRNDWSRIVE